MKVSGLKGGHSGGDIHVGLGNANKLLVRYLYKVLKEVPEMRLATIDGGNLHNAIPREAKAVITIPANRKEDLAIWANEMDAEFRNELKKVDPNVNLRVATTTTPKEVVCLLYTSVGWLYDDVIDLVGRGHNRTLRIVIVANVLKAYVAWLCRVW